MARPGWPAPVRPDPADRLTPASTHAPWEGRHLPAGAYRWGLLAVTACGALLRVAHLGRPFNGFGATAWNEGHYALIALNFDRYGLWSPHNELGLDHTFSPGVPWLIWLAFKAFGSSEWSARLPIVLFGIAAVPLVAALVRRMTASEQIALAAAGLAATIPEAVYFSQNVQLDTPSVCCALAGAVALLRYRDTRRRGDLIAAGICVTLAIWFKFTTALLYPAYLALWQPAGRGDGSRPSPSRWPAGVVAAMTFVAITALPSAAWELHGRLTHQTFIGFYQRDWSFRDVAQALVELPLMIGAHLFPLGFVLFIAGLPAAIRWRARLRGLWSWCLVWIVLYVLAPRSALTNRYYDLPAAYLLTLVAAVGLWMPLARRWSGRALARAVVASVAIVMAVLGAYDLWDPTTDRLARAMRAHPAPLDPAPFYSAKVVARLPRRRTVVDAPQTMFYAGGDPAWISIVGGDGDVREAIEGERFDYILLNDYWHQQEPYYPLDEVLRARLARHHYAQIAPAAWAYTGSR